MGPWQVNQAFVAERVIKTILIATVIILYLVQDL